MGKTTPHGVTTPKGFQAAGGTCGIKKSGRPDLALIVATKPCTAAGVFTTNKVPAEAVMVGRRHLRSGTAQAIICNSGNANAATGPTGQKNTALMCKWVAQHTALSGGNPRLVLPNSTGVIGQQLPMDKIAQGIAKLANKLSRGPDANAAVAQAILTTDRVPKQAHRSVRLGPKRDRLVHLGGVAKGSGMIAPNMATMLAFITTDANISTKMLASSLRQATAVSFNRVSVDQHTSPSDAVLVLASAAASNPRISKAGKDHQRFQEALVELCQDLAYQIVQDGEGATKVIRVCVLRAAKQADADRVAKTVVDSPLVKTAVHGGSPNWGRMVTAAGYSGVGIRPEKLSLHIGGRRFQSVCVFAAGQPVPLRAAQQRRLAKIMTGQEVVVTLDLGLGRANTQWLGCDLSRQYVAINADYTT